MTGGWLAGLLSTLLSDRLLRADALYRAAPRHPLLRDPLVQGSLAVLWGASAYQRGPSLEWLACAILAVPLVQIAATDLRFRYVYLWFLAAGGVAAIILAPVLHGAPWWAGLAGGAAGLLVFGLFFALGKLLARFRYRGQEPLARGDIWIGGLVGAVAAFQAPAALIAGSLFSAALAIFVLVRQRSGSVYMPYGPGLCLGGLLALFLR